jgi:hypothetical protein
VHFIDDSIMKLKKQLKIICFDNFDEVNKFFGIQKQELKELARCNLGNFFNTILMVKRF